MAEVFSISGAGMGVSQNQQQQNWAQRSALRLAQMQHRQRTNQPLSTIHPHHRRHHAVHFPSGRMLRRVQRGIVQGIERGANTGPGHFSGFGAACPAGFTTTAKGNCQGALATPLQNALRALGKAVGGDPSLMSLSVDGSIGPATVAAVNRAFTTHIGPGQMPAQFRTGTLGISDIAANAAQFTSYIAAEVLRRGGSLAPPTPSAAARPPTSAYTPPTTASLDPGAGPPGLSTPSWTLIGVAVIAVVGGAWVLFSKPDAAPARRRR